MFEPSRTLVLGTGYVSGAYMRALHHLGLRPVALSRDWLDYTNPDELEFFVESHKPQLIINAAGYTGETVDDCEVNKDDCYNANVVLPRNLAHICKELHISLFHISSGCIFTGNGPFKEEDKANNHGQFYAQCKIAAEEEVLDSGANAWIFRIRMPFGNRRHRRNWLSKLAAYDRILDGVNSVTFLDEFAIRSYQLAERAPPGVYHAACSTPINTIAVASMLRTQGIRTKPVEFFPPDSFYESGHVHRSAAVLDVSKFEKAYGAPFGTSHSALSWCIANFGVANNQIPRQGWHP